jgi:hypothetical protein
MQARCSILNYFCHYWHSCQFLKWLKIKKNHATLLYVCSFGQQYIVQLTTNKQLEKNVHFLCMAVRLQPVNSKHCHVKFCTQPSTVNFKHILSHNHTLVALLHLIIPFNFYFIFKGLSNELFCFKSKLLQGCARKGGKIEKFQIPNCKN